MVGRITPNSSILFRGTINFYIQLEDTVAVFATFLSIKYEGCLNNCKLISNIPR